MGKYFEDRSLVRSFIQLPYETRHRVSVATLDWTLSLIDGNEEFENKHREEVETILDAVKNDSYRFDKYLINKAREINVRRPSPGDHVALFVTSFVYAARDIPYTKNTDFVILDINLLATRIDNLKIMPREEYIHSLQSLIEAVVS